MLVRRADLLRVPARVHRRANGQITSLLAERLRAVVENDHLIGNHSYDHPVGNPSFCDLTTTQQLQQIVFTHRIVDSAVEQIAASYVGNMRRWLRSPGNVSWSVPDPGHRREDIFCSTRDSTTVRALPNRNRDLVLFLHGLATCQALGSFGYLDWTRYPFKLNTTPSTIAEKSDAWILHVPRFGKQGMHYHTYGQLTPGREHARTAS